MTDSYERMKAQKDAMTETEAAQKLANLSKALLDDANAECRELREALTDCAQALSVALQVADEVHDEWDADMRPGKLLIALIDPSVRYRADISAMHATKARVDEILNEHIPDKGQHEGDA